MTRNVTVIVTGVGGGVGQSIVKGLNLALERGADVTYEIIGVDADPTAAGLYRTDGGFRVPMAEHPDYIDRLIEIAQEVSADVLIPGSDPEVLAVAQARNRLEDEGGATVLSSPPDTVQIGLDKWETYQFLTENGFRTPKTVLADDADDLVEADGFPLVVKPRTGSASRGLYIVTDQSELDYALDRAPDPIIQEYLVPENWDGELCLSDLERQMDEYSTEVIVDVDGEIVNSLANWREMDKGVPSVAKVRPYEKIRTACESVVEELDVLGPVNLQARVTDAGVSFFEINTRFTGSTAVRCVAGFNGPHAMVRNLVLGEAITDDDLAFENLVEMRYKDEIYVDESTYDELCSSGSVENGGRIYRYF